MPLLGIPEIFISRPFPIKQSTPPNNPNLEKAFSYVSYVMQSLLHRVVTCVLEPAKLNEQLHYHNH
jgi:hypothetical protein